MSALPSETPRPSRRFVLQAAGAGLLVTASAAACDLSTSPRSRHEQHGGGSGDTREAPALAEQVKAGKLPPLSRRLPDKPLVVTPVEKVGTYGGTWRTGFLGPANSYWIYYTAGYEGLVRWDSKWNQVVPNVAESVEASPDGKEFTFTLRKGVRWSDGKPFTAADIMFSWEDCMLNKDLFPIPVSFMVSADGKPAQLTKVDDHTFRVSFDTPNGLFLQRMASQSYGTVFGDTASYPRHYLGKSHPKYNPSAKQDARKQHFSKWTELFLSKADYTTNLDLPTLNAWHLTSPVGRGNQASVGRNPYYWKVDTDGKQLPYIDRIVYDTAGDPNTMLLKVMNGEYQFHYPVVNTLQNKPVIARYRDRGRYKIFPMTFTRMNWMVIALNLTHRDAATRRTFQNRDFRIALSHAINRTQLIEAVFQRTGKPWQAAPRQEQAEFYDEEMATQYTEYDLDKANKLLDAAGYERDKNGARLGADGKPIFITFDVNNGDTQAVDALGFVRDDWKNLGIHIEINSIDRSLFYTRKEANKHDASVWGGDGGLKDAMLDPRWYFPANAESNYAVPWATWFTSRGQSGEKPPAAPLRQMQLYWKLLEEPGADRRTDIFREILKIAKQQFYVIGTVLPLSVYGVKTDNFKNAPDPMILAYLHPDPGPDRPEQFFLNS
ncbi:peptide/nickel transport system substrate-binding protein [Actinopolymorpha singaporensis]|uniref:Peptide/nickel transport system substrate-binding protein n=2 Tax=Actinopolymorpha singaporensis TaxID=117157 RepID=A0A1H1QZT6_9ACTN|nr:peptide/nickel transport system substrate-binding protein [Actinopolymorpha singaporensis]